MTIPPLPPHYRAVGKTTWNAASYCTNAIDADDKPGNRVALKDDAREVRVLDYLSFHVMEWTNGRVWRAWIWRYGMDEALYFTQGDSKQAWKRARKAVEEQQAVDAALGKHVLTTPIIEEWSERK